MGSISRRDFKRALRLSPTDRLHTAMERKIDVDHFSTIDHLVESGVQFIVTGDVAAVLHGVPFEPTVFHALIEPVAGNYRRLQRAMRRMERDFVAFGGDLGTPYFEPELFVPEDLPYATVAGQAVTMIVGHHSLGVACVDHLIHLADARFNELETAPWDWNADTRDQREVQLDYIAELISLWEVMGVEMADGLDR